MPVDDEQIEIRFAPVEAGTKAGALAADILLEQLRRLAYQELLPLARIDVQVAAEERLYARAFEPGRGDA